MAFREDGKKYEEAQPDATAHRLYHVLSNHRVRGSAWLTWDDRRRKMLSVAIRIDPRCLVTANADLRYRLPDLLSARSAGAIEDDGYDYVGEPPYMVIFLRVRDASLALAIINDVVAHEEVLGERLAEAAVVAIEDGAGFKVVYPAGFLGEFEVDVPKA